MRNGLPCAADAGAAVDQDGLIEPLVRFPNLLELVIGERGMLVVANWNVFSPQSAGSIIGDQISRKLLIQVKLSFVQ